MADEQLGRLTLDGGERILDVGCGDGKITAEISARLPRGSALGVDPSRDMIAFASSRFGPPAQATLRFQEFRESGDPLSPSTLTLPGEEIYLDALVTVFDSEAVRTGEAKSLYRFRRIFTDRVPPRQGVALYRDAHAFDGIPQPYVHSTIERDIQRLVWERLWSLIEQPAYAEAQRVRTFLGQAVYARMALGGCYTVTLQNHGGLLLTNSTP
jgi:SAM-dependent methyltransferase